MAYVQTSVMTLMQRHWLCWSGCGMRWWEQMPTGDQDADDDTDEAEREVFDRDLLDKAVLVVAMKSLSPRQAQCMRRSVVGGMSSYEIARELGIEAVSVRTYLMRARRRINALLTKVSTDSRYG